MLLRIKSLRDCFAGKKFRLILRRYTSQQHGIATLQYHNIIVSNTSKQGPHLRTSGMDHLGGACFSALIPNTELYAAGELTAEVDIPQEVFAVLQAVEDGKTDGRSGLADKVDIDIGKVELER